MAFTYKVTDEYKDALKKESQDEANLRNYQTYTPTEYAESDEVKGLWNTISNWEHPTWDRNNNQWWNKLTDTMNAIENREKFSYDVNGDALYQQYKDQYINQGKMAMMDTMGQAAAMTGGYGNSYAQSVGQQAYQGYLQQLTDKIPELYQMALDKYNSEGAEMYNKLSAYGDLYSTEYGEHRDAVSDSKDALAHKTDLYGIKSDEDYKHWYNGEQLKMAASEQEYQKLADLLGISTEAAQRIFDNSYKSQFDSYTTKYTEEQDEIANDLALKKLKEEQRQFDENLKYDATGSATLSDGTEVEKVATAAVNATIPDYVMDKVKTFTVNDDLHSYLTFLESQNIISEEQGDALYETYKNTSLTGNKWELDYDGGVHIGKLDGDARVKYGGNVYTIDQLYTKLQNEGMSKADAKAYLINLQKSLGITK